MGHAVTVRYIFRHKSRIHAVSCSKQLNIKFCEGDFSDGIQKKITNEVFYRHLANLPTRHCTKSWLTWQEKLGGSGSCERAARTSPDTRYIVHSAT